MHGKPEKNQLRLKKKKKKITQTSLGSANSQFATHQWRPLETEWITDALEPVLAQLDCTQGGRLRTNTYEKIIPPSTPTPQITIALKTRTVLIVVFVILTGDSHKPGDFLKHQYRLAVWIGWKDAWKIGNKCPGYWRMKSNCPWTVSWSEECPSLKYLVWTDRKKKGGNNRSLLVAYVRTLIAQVRVLCHSSPVRNLVLYY